MDNGKPLLTDSEIDRLAGEFRRSSYYTFANWPLDRRLVGFLHDQGLRRAANDGDIARRLAERVMASSR